MHHKTYWNVKLIAKLVIQFWANNEMTLLCRGTELTKRYNSSKCISIHGLKYGTGPYTLTYNRNNSFIKQVANITIYKSTSYNI